MGPSHFSRLIFTCVIAAAASSAQAGFMIDDFDVPAGGQWQASFGGPWARREADGVGVLGGSREIRAQRTGGLGIFTTTINQCNLGVLIATQTGFGGANGHFTLIYDGNDSAANGNGAVGFSAGGGTGFSQDFTEGFADWATNSSIVLNGLENDSTNSNPVALTLSLWTSPTTSFTAPVYSLPQGASGDVSFSLGSFTGLTQAGAQSITGFTLKMDPGSGRTYTITLDSIELVHTGSVSPAPEPSSMALAVIGAVTLIGSRLRRRRTAAVSNT
jgi:hypothetical protein